MRQTARRQAKMNANSEPEKPPSCDNARLTKQIEESFKATQAELSPVKIEEIVSQWLTRNHVERDEAAAAIALLEAFVLACQMLLFTPSLTGVRPIDRFIRQRATEPEGTTARTALAKARFHLLRLKSRIAPDTLIAEDLADGARLNLFDTENS